MVKLSVCMITKNEESTIARILECAKKFADEIVVVDTGSTDNTTKIAKKYTDKVFYFKWNNDFSKARNFSIQNATGDYVMWLDADDFITQKNIKMLQKLKNELSADTYMLKYQIAFDENNKPTFEYFRERIIKKCPLCKFEGFIHEAIVPFGKIEYTAIAIEHRKEDKKKDKKRNLKIYNYHLKNGIVLNERETFYYARELYYNGFYKRAIKIMRRFLKMKNKFLPNVIDSYMVLSDCYDHIKNQEKAESVLIDSMKVLPPNAEICCKIGNFEIRKNNYKNAIFWFKTALNSQKNEKSGAFIQNDYYDFIPFLQLSFCFYKLNDMENFVKYHKLARKIKPNDISILNNEKFIKNI